MPADNVPWVPPSLAGRLRVGARVRVRLSGECRAWLPRHSGFWLAGHRACHPRVLDGMIVRIVEIDPGFGEPGHDYLVETPPIDIGDGHRCARILAFAASELEPLDGGQEG